MIFLELKKQMVKGFVFLLLANIFSRATQFFSKIILAWFLLPKAFGLFAIGFLVISILEAFRSSGLEQAVIFTKRDIKKAANTVFFMQFAIAIALFLIVFLVAGAIGEFFGKSATEAIDIMRVTQVLSTVIIVNSLGAVHGALLEKKMEFKKRVLPDIFSAAAYFVVVIWLAAQGLGVWSLVFATIASSILYNLMLVVLSPIRIFFRTDFALGKELFGYGKFILASAIITFLVTNLDSVAIGRLLSIEALGFYSMAATISVLLPTQLALVVSKVMFPVYTIVNDKKEKLKEAYSKSISYSLLFFMPLAFGTIVLAPFFVQAVLGNKWESIAMIAVMQALAINGLIRVVGSITTPILLAIGKPKYISFGALVQLIVLALIIWPLTAAMGIIGTSIAVTATTFVVTAYFVFLVCKNIGLRKRMLFSSAAKVFLASAIMAILVFLASLLFTKKNLASFLLLCTIAIFSFFALALFFEKKTIKSLLNDFSSAGKKSFF